MIELLRQDDSTLTLNYTASAYATGLVFEVYDLDSNDFIQGGTGSASVTTASYIQYNITLNSDSTQYDRNIKVEFVTTTASGAYSEINRYSMRRPYATASRIRDIATIQNSTTDATLQKLERRARMIIDSFVGFAFYKKKKSLDAYGNNTDVLFMNEEILSVNKIYEDDLLVYENGSSEYQFDYPIEVSVSNNRIKIVNSTEKNKESLEFPKFSVFHYDGIFKKDHLYEVDGVFGYEYVPSAVEEAAALLVEDYLCNDSNIRNKNIVELSNDSYDIKYAADFATGTGNLIVDSLLAEYRQPRFMVI